MVLADTFEHAKAAAEIIATGEHGVTYESKDAILSIEEAVQAGSYHDMTSSMFNSERVCNVKHGEAKEILAAADESTVLLQGMISTPPQKHCECSNGRFAVTVARL